MYNFIAVVPSKWIKRPQEAKPTAKIHTRMLNKKQALEILGVSPTNPIKNEIFESLPQYANPFNTQAIFREEDVIDLLRSFPVASLNNQTTTA